MMHTDDVFCEVIVSPHCVTHDYDLPSLSLEECSVMRVFRRARCGHIECYHQILRKKVHEVTEEEKSDHLKLSEKFTELNDCQRCKYLQTNPETKAELKYFNHLHRQKRIKEKFNIINDGYFVSTELKVKKWEIAVFNVILRQLADSMHNRYKSVYDLSLGDFCFPFFGVDYAGFFSSKKEMDAYIKKHKNKTLIMQRFFELVNGSGCFDRVVFSKEDILKRNEDAIKQLVSFVDD